MISIIPNHCVKNISPRYIPLISFKFYIIVIGEKKLLHLYAVTFLSVVAKVSDIPSRDKKFTFRRMKRSILHSCSFLQALIQFYTVKLD